MIHVSLDLSDAFDTIYHSILLSRLYTSYGIHGSTLTWFKSYISNQHQFVSIGNSISPSLFQQTKFHRGPSLHLLFSPSTSHPLRKSLGLSQQQYTSDTQLYVAVTKSNLSFNVRKLEQCLSCSVLMALPLTLTSPMPTSSALGSDHTLFLLLSVSMSLAARFSASSDIKILSVNLDRALSLNKHVVLVSKTYFYYIRALRNIRKSLTDNSAKSIA